MRTRPIYFNYDVTFYKEQLVKAISLYGLPSGARRRLRLDPDFDAQAYLGYMQPSAAIYWQCYLYSSLRAAGVDASPNLSTITILDKRWHFGERNWNFQPGKIMYQVRRALKGLNYLVMIEFEIFRNVRYLEPLPPNNLLPHLNHGRLIAPHIQGLIWGRLPSQKQRALFAGGVFGAPGVKVVGVHKFAGALRYMAKPPYRGRSVFPRLRGGYGRRPWKNMSLTLHHLLFCNLHRFCYPDLTFAGGEGRAVLAHAKRLWRDYEVCGVRPAADPQPRFEQIWLSRVRR